MKYRSKIEIVADMLLVAREKVKKTHIMYRGNLSFKLLNAYLGVVVKAGLIRFSQEDDRYMLTEKGQMFLQRFNKYNRRAKELQRQVSKMKGEMASLEEMCSGAELPADTNGMSRDEDGVNGEDGNRVKSNRLPKQGEF